jgi:L-amino acid N-acyltransferase YncA
MPLLHRRRPKIVGALFATSVLERGELAGIACASEPKAPRSRKRRVVEISRVATLGTRNACSKLYGALCRAAAALGYRRAITFTDPDEPGTSLRAAGFQDDGLTREQSWDRPSNRRRGKARSEQLSQVRRWSRDLAGKGT